MDHSIDVSPSISDTTYLQVTRNTRALDAWRVMAHSHYCVFRVRLRQKVALLRRDRKFPISALTQSTAESADRCGECE